MSRQITKIKLGKDSKVHIEYQVPRTVETGQDFDQFTLNCVDKPLPALELAMLNLRKHVLDICEMPIDDTEVMKVKVKGVSFSYSGDDDIMGATITASKTLARSNAPLMINTPHKFDQTHNENQSTEMLLSDDCISVLVELLEQAEKYLDGERAQLEMFNQDSVKAVDTGNLSLKIPEAAHA